MKRLSPFLAVLGLCFGLGSACAASEGTWSCAESSDRLAITLAGERVTEFVFQDERVLRPYFANLRVPGGIQVTRNHPPVAGVDATDHDTMHPGVWLAFGDINGADFWRNKGRIEHVRFVQTPSAGEGRLTFATECRLVDGDDTIGMLTNRFALRPEAGGWLLEWEAEFAAHLGDLTFGDQEEMGFGARVATALTEKNGGLITSSSGRTMAGDTWGQAADWCDYSGSLDGRRAGILLMADPANFRPSWWHNRNYGLMVANPFGRKAMEQGERSAVIVKQGENLRLRFGALVYAVATDTEMDFAALFGAFAAGDAGKGRGVPGSSAGPILRGPPTRYFVDVERYRFSGPDLGNSNFYGIPQTPVTRDTYLRTIEETNPAAIARNPHRGMNGPRAFMPVLVKYVLTGDRVWSDAIIEMLKAFHGELRRQVAERKWFWQFEDPAALIPLYRQHLIAGGAMREDAAWFREMWLHYCRHLHVWDSAPVEWRGGCHRSMPEALSKGLAAKWYPDIPEAAGWKRYSELVFQDFWKVKDAPQNDTGYMMGPLITLACGGDQWTGDDRVFTDPDMKRLWDRLLVEITPDGAVNPYGPNGGWNSTADYRIAMLERLAARTGDGRYRFGAHKLFNHMLYQSPGATPDTVRPDHWSSWLISLAWLFANDAVAPVEPDGASVWTKRMEAVRIPHTDKELIERLMGGADPRDNHGHVCCSWYMTGHEWPDKLVLRSGWNPGDFFALVELHPTSFPANPGGIMGMNRWGAPFTQIVTSKGASVENRAMIVDVEGTARRRLHPDKLRIDEFWRGGQMPDIRSEVTHFEDTAGATFVRVRVRNLDGLPVTYEREFVFVKNRFLATREIVTFEEGFRARVAPLWNTQNVGPQIGEHWANTFMSAPVADNGNRSMKTPPVDLLVWFAPRDDCRLNVVDRLAEDARAEACPNQVRYQWEGDARPGQQLVFTQVYLPHPPYRARATTNNPNPGAKAAYADELQATAGASAIRVLRDDPRATVLRLESAPGSVEWVVFNPGEETLRLEGKSIAEPYAYLEPPTP